MIPGWEIWATGLIVALVLAGLWRNVAGPDVLLMGGALTLITLSLASPAFPGPTQFAANFGNEGVLTVGALFIVAAGLTETGGMSLLTERILGRPRSQTGAVARLMIPVATMSAFLNNTPLVAMFIPLVSDWSKKIGVSASKLLMPLSYAAILGGITTLIGTSTNLVVQALLVEAHKTNPEIQPMQLFTLTPVGVPVAIGGVLFVVVASRWLLPSRTSLLTRAADTRQYTAEMQVTPGSGIDGVTIEAAGLRHLPGSYLIAIERQGEVLPAVGPSQVLRGGDQLVFVGLVESVAELQRVRGLVPASAEMAQTTASQLNRLLVEVVVSGTSPLVGRTIRDGQFRTRYDAAVIAVYRDGAHLQRQDRQHRPAGRRRAAAAGAQRFRRPSPQRPRLPASRAGRGHETGPASSRWRGRRDPGRHGARRGTREYHLGQHLSRSARRCGADGAGGVRIGAAGAPEPGPLDSDLDCRRPDDRTGDGTVRTGDDGRRVPERA